MKNILQFETAKGAIKTLLAMAESDAAEMMGMSEQNWKLMTQSSPWQGVNRQKVTSCLQQVLYGVIDTLGLPRFEVPAEMGAACVALVCHPSNLFQACSFLGGMCRAEDLASTKQPQPVEGMERVRPAQLFALCLQILSEEETATLVNEFQKKSNTALGSVIGKEVQPNEKTDIQKR